MILSAVVVAALAADITKLSGCTREIGPSVRTLSSASVDCRAPFVCRRKEVFLSPPRDFILSFVRSRIVYF